MLQRIVVDPTQIQPPTITLTSEQQHYLIRVLRLKVGDRLIAMNGQGQSWMGELATVEATFHANIIEPVQTQTELPISVTLVIALPKGNAFDEVVRQATELGVSEIVPVISDRTLLQPSSQKLDRWRRIIQEAAEQSERQFVPDLLNPLPFSTHLQKISAAASPASHYLCTPRISAPSLLALLLNSPLPSPPFQPSTQNSELRTSFPLPIYIAIGPEGGWTDAEITQAIAAGYQLVSLGDRILRTVTAPIAALSLVAAVCENNSIP